MTYEYECLNCGAEIEVEQKITEEPLEFYRHTPKGGMRVGRTCSGQLKRLISGGAFILKGGGWADDGYTEQT